MGQSTDAIIAFGVDLGEDLPFPEEDDDLDLGHYLAKRAGHINPYSEVPDAINFGPYAEFKVWEEEHPEWKAKSKEWFRIGRELEEAAPIEIVYHCSYECSMFILAAKGTVKRASRGYPEEFDPGQLPANGNGIDVPVIRKFCEEQELPAFDDPKWLLFSMWGV